MTARRAASRCISTAPGSRADSTASPLPIVCLQCGPQPRRRRPKAACTFWRETPIRFYRCPLCGLVFKDPNAYQAEEAYRFDAEGAPATDPSAALGEFHRTFHTAGRIANDDGELYASFGYDQRQLVSGIFDTVDSRLRERQGCSAQSPLRLLEVGCATGFLLGQLRQAYPRAELVGVDPSPFSTAQARRIPGIEVHCGTLDTVALPEGRFDAVVMIGNLQLHRDPRATLATIARLLRPGGLLIFDAKNPDSWFRIVGRSLSRTWPLNRLRAVRRLVNYSHTGMRYGVPKALLQEWLREAGFETLEACTKNLRVFDFHNRRGMSRGPRRLLWNAVNTIDVVRDQRAWLQLCCRKSA